MCKMQVAGVKAVTGLLNAQQRAILSLHRVLLMFVGIQVTLRTCVTGKPAYWLAAIRVQVSSINLPS